MKSISLMLLLTGLLLSGNDCQQRKHFVKTINNADTLVINTLIIDTLKIDREAENPLIVDSLHLKRLAYKFSTESTTILPFSGNIKLSATGKTIYLDSLFTPKQSFGLLDTDSIISNVFVENTELERVNINLQNKKGKNAEKITFNTKKGKVIKIQNTIVYNGIVNGKLKVDGVNSKYAKRMAKSLNYAVAKIPKVRKNINEKLAKFPDHPIGDIVTYLDDIEVDLYELEQFIYNINDDTPLPIIKAKALELSDIITSLASIGEAAEATDDTNELLSDVFFKPGKWDILTTYELDLLVDDLLSEVALEEMATESLKTTLYIKVVGYTDEQGFFDSTITDICNAIGKQRPNLTNEEDNRKLINLWLSELRAEEVRQYLDYQIRNKLGNSSQVDIMVTSDGKGEELPPGIIPKNITDDDRRRRSMVYKVPFKLRKETDESESF